MRAAVAASVAALFLLIAAGCGSSAAATGGPSLDAAGVVPSTALAFLSADANLDSQGWKTLSKVYPIALDENIARDLPAAVGDELNLVVLGLDQGKPEVVAIVKSKDRAKLQSLAKKFDQGNEHYTVEDIAGWQVVADSAESFQAIRDASTGTSLAETQEFKQAAAQLDDGLAFAYANGSVVKTLQANLRSLIGTPRWLAASLVADKNDLKLDVRATGGKVPAVYRPTMLRDAPSGSALAVSFKNLNELGALLPASFLPVVKGISGEGVLYVSPASLLPVVTLEVRPKDPAAAAKSLRALANRAKSGLQLQVRREGAKVLLTNSTRFDTGASLADDKQFKDAVAAADVPNDVTWLAYADMPRLAPLIQAFAALSGTGQKKQEPSKLRLDKLGTVVAYAARTASGSQLVVRATVP